MYHLATLDLMVAWPGGAATRSNDNLFGAFESKTFF
jgi:hypothetical protein